MGDNPQRYGFRPVGLRAGFMHGGQQMAFCATAASFDVNGGASNVLLRPGDPIVRLTTGGVNLAPGSEGTPGDVLGVVVGIKQYYDAALGVVTQRGNGIPSDIAWGTNTDLQSQLYFIPAEAAVFAIQVDEATTATTRAAYEAFIGENCSHVLTATSGTAATPKLDIATHAATATLDWRIVGIANPNLTDFSGANVELLVVCNRPQDFTGATTMWLGI